MQIYLVGGAVRDRLLGLPVKDHDWVVVGATPQQLVDRGFLPVGKDFPVFLHPRSKEQYALARTERKTAPGYRGFAIQAAPDVTLEQDLARRDLTINAIAIEARQVQPDGSFDASADALIDPFDGQRDLKHKVLRHVSDAFQEDPVRILRVARFAARFSDFEVAAQTMDLMRVMVAAGEVAALVAERVWQELARGLMEDTPSRMFEVLHACGAFSALMPELEALWFGAPDARQGTSDAVFAQAHALRAVDIAAGRDAPLPVRFACLWLADSDRSRVRGTNPPDMHASGSHAPITHTPVTHGSAAHAPATHATAAEAADTETRGSEAAGTRRSDRDAQDFDAPGTDAAFARLCDRLRVTIECREMAQVARRECRHIAAAARLDAQSLVLLLERCDAFRKPERFDDLLLACECQAVAQAENQPGAADGAARAHLLAALDVARRVCTADVAAKAHADGITGQQIGERVRAERVAAVAAMPGLH
ncbi:MAG: multifunctional CCA tRNA nucleotidyl transferase/2'3'-cyclic phosphodiesterase/2'nucleotidase/phosphatase [Burkholderiaceae bacterium]